MVSKRKSVSASPLAPPCVMGGERLPECEKSGEGGASTTSNEKLMGGAPQNTPEITSKEIFQKILSNKMSIQGACVECGNGYIRFGNSKKEIEYVSPYCSVSCKKIAEDRQKQIKHYMVFKDLKYYYLTLNGLFFAKRTLSGRITYSLPSERSPLSDDKDLQEFEFIPSYAVKIIDKKSKFLYDNKHPFSNWKNLVLRGEKK